MSCVQGRLAAFPQAGIVCYDCFLDLLVLTALSVPSVLAMTCAGATQFKRRLTSKERISLPLLLILNSLSKYNWRMSQ